MATTAQPPLSSVRAMASSSCVLPTNGRRTGVGPLDTTRLWDTAVRVRRPRRDAAASAVVHSAWTDCARSRVSRRRAARARCRQFFPLDPSPLTQPDPNDKLPAHRSGWLAIERRHLAALRAVARARSFRGAAEELGYVQSAVSQQIAFLERLLGFRLIERARGQRTVSLTRAGEVMLAHSAEIVAEFNTLQADMDAVTHGRLGVVRIGAAEDVARRFLPAMVRSFARVRPQVDVLTKVGSDHELLADCEAGRVDLILVDLPISPARFAWHELFTDQYVLLVPADSQLARQGAVSRPSDIAGLQLIVHRGSRQSVRIDAQLRARGVTPLRVREADSAALIQALVGAGVGSALLPERTVDSSDTATITIDVGDLVAPRILCSAWRRGAGPSATRSAWLAAASAALCGSRTV
jgi:DNA-binding transcriptional LysR family regulator